MSLEGHQLGHYRLQRLIGSGGMGEIYLAQDTHVPRLVAVKVLRTEKDIFNNSQKAQEAERLFEREMQTISSLDHPHILPIFDYGTERIGNIEPTYLVMPYRPEGSLYDWLCQHHNTTLPEYHKVINILLQAAEALQHAHERHIIHQDIKPANFLIRTRTSDTDVPDILLADFGIAKFIDATSSASQSVRGTPAYMSPEQWEGQPAPASDQYSLAIMAFLLLTGQVPFRGSFAQAMRQHISVSPSMPSSINPHLPPEVDTVLLRALAKQPEERFPSVLEFVQALQRAFQYNKPQQSSSMNNQSPAPVTLRSQWSQDRGYLIALSKGEFEPVTSSGTLQHETITRNPSHSQMASVHSSPSIQSTASVSLSTSTQDTPISLNTPVAVSVAAPLDTPTPAQIDPSPFIPSSGEHSRSKKFLLIVVAALVVVCGSGIAFYTLGKPASPRSQANGPIAPTQPTTPVTTQSTAQTIAKATTQTIANATVQTNLTAQAQLQATAGVIQTATASHAQNVLSDPNAHWQNDGTSCIANTEYHVKAEVDQAQFCRELGDVFQNATITVDMVNMSGYSGGLLFRVQGNNANNVSYFFEIGTGGNYQISILGVKIIQAWTNSPAINKDNGSLNKLQLITHGNDFYFYVNDAYLMHIANASYATGGLGFACYTDAKSACETVFSNLNVY